MSAVISNCKRYRYRLDRDVQAHGLVFAYFGVNPSTADAEKDDQTIRKLKGFTQIYGGSRFIVGNPFAARCKEVKKLATINNPVGTDNEYYLHRIINEADILIPCWGNRSKVPEILHSHFDSLLAWLIRSGKPVCTFGLTKSNDPKHPLMLGYDTKLTLIQGK